MTNLNPTTDNFKIANYNFCKNNGVFQDRLRILIPISMEHKAIELLNKFPKYCKVEMFQTSTNNDDRSPSCYCLSAQYYNPKNFIDLKDEVDNGVINSSAIKRSMKISEVLKENNIKSF